MSDGSTGAIGPVSVRYAAQIRELLYAQAVQRMAAEEEAARANADAERAARSEAVAKAQAAEPLDVKVQTPEPAIYKPAPARQPDAPTDKPAVTAGQLVDIQA
ncbi:MAG: hypothetical protein ABMA14_25420 [Hyphomonadaceae bacterium]